MMLNPPNGEFPRISDIGNKTLPKVGDYVKLMVNGYANPQIFEGVVCSCLFDRSFEVGYTDSADQPITHWFDVGELLAMQIIS